MATNGRLNTANSVTDELSRRLVQCDDNNGITAITAGNRTNRMVALSEATVRLWVYDADSTEEGSSGTLRPDDSPAAGRWHPEGNLQSGTATLAAGTVTITGVRLTANSRIVLSMKDPGAGAITGFAALDAPVASRSVASRQFVVNAIDDAKATIATAVSTFDWMIVDAG